MPRPKTMTDTAVLEAALRLIHQQGPQALTFDSLSKICGLSGSTLVQRFGTKAALKQAALHHAWDTLDDRTAALAASVDKTPDGAVDLLVGLSMDYGGIESYAEGLLVLREDLSDPALRARGAAWKAALSGALDDCLASSPEFAEGAGMMLAAQWQGSLLWWSFEPDLPVQDQVRQALSALVVALGRRQAG